MDRATYKATRRAIIIGGINDIFDGLLGLRVRALEKADFDEMLTDEDNLIDFIPEDEDEA
jgi:hypothetical protein